MKLVTGNLWDAPALVGATLIAVTTNSTVKRNGRLVMGAGAAKEAVERYPDFDAEAGFAVAWFQERHGHVDYGFIPLRYELRGAVMVPTLGLFQTKYHPGERADLDLIHRSCGALRRWLANDAPAGTVVALNFPGVGLGNLRRRDVLPVLEQELPDAVIVFELQPHVLLDDRRLRLIEALTRCSFQPGSFPKRFIRDMATRTDSLSERQDAVLENLRRQYRRQLQRIAPDLVADLGEPPPAPSQAERERLDGWNAAARQFNEGSNDGRAT